MHPCRQTARSCYGVTSTHREDLARLPKHPDQSGAQHVGDNTDKIASQRFGSGRQAVVSHTRHLASRRAEGSLRGVVANVHNYYHTVDAETGVQAISGLRYFNKSMKPSVAISSLTELEEALLPRGVCLQKWARSRHAVHCVAETSVCPQSTTNGSTNEVPDTDVTNTRFVRFFCRDGEPVCRAPATLQLDKRGYAMNSRPFRKIFAGNNY